MSDETATLSYEESTSANLNLDTSIPRLEATAEVAAEDPIPPKSNKRKTSKKTKPKGKTTAYSFWRKSKHALSLGNRTVKEFRAIWTGLDPDIRRPFEDLAEQDRVRFRREKAVLEALQENVEDNQLEEEEEETHQPAKRQRSNHVMAIPYTNEGELITLHMGLTVHSNDTTLGFNLYGPLNDVHISPEILSMYESFTGMKNEWFDVYYKRQKLQEGLWNDVLLLQPKKKEVQITVKIHKSLFNYASGLWLNGNPTCPCCFESAETYSFRTSSLNACLLEQCDFDAKALVTGMEENRSAQLDEDHCFMRFCKDGHLTIEFPFQEQSKGPLEMAPLLSAFQPCYAPYTYYI